MSTLYLPPDTIWQRILDRVEIQPNGCWHWTGAVNSKGYGCIGAGRKARNVLVHRVALLVRDGVLHAGLVSDHTCHNDDPTCPGGVACQHRRCVNPAHLDQVTPKVNVNRAGHGTQRQCAAGHDFDDTNTYLHTHGSKAPTRGCRSCRVLRDVARRR
jgi:hypothetical protein